MEDTSSWSDLPQCLAELILKHLSVPNCLSFGSVCRSWSLAQRQCPHRLEPPFIVFYRSAAAARGIIKILSLPDQRTYKMCWKKDSKALLVIQQAVHESIFPRIAVANKSKDAWKILKDEYQSTNKRINRSAEKVIEQAFQSKLEVSPEKLKSQGSGVEQQFAGRGRGQNRGRGRGRNTAERGSLHDGAITFIYIYGGIAGSSYIFNGDVTQFTK
ncbi:hypothetical protein MRB53_009881 [Persea americana]|uniref:Uncharacterized protein n=1 Tax=Persea americana TaxID=3435 RepID=A0ACC2LQA4_PERAE|nr:hypothetical protein MRB53_009881 [Persea americana]